MGVADQVGSPGGFAVRAHIMNERLDEWRCYEDEKSRGWSWWGGGHQEFSLEAILSSQFDIQVWS